MADSDFTADLIPYLLDVEAGKTYYWCTCGHSQTQPLCDGSHSGTDKLPMPFTAERTEQLNLCGCKQSQNPPFCDGTHNMI